VENTRHGLIDQAELERIVAHLPEPAQDAVLFGSLTGWRVGEIRGLTWDRVDLQAGLVRLDTSKTGEGRVRPLVEPELRALLEKRWRLRAIGCPFVFHRDGRRLSDTWLGHAWRTACDRAGLPGRYFHDLRRSAYRDLVSRAGVDLVTAMELVGHKSLNVARRYNVVETGRLTRALDLVTRMRARQVSDNSRTSGPAEPPARSS
jgi:integrase